MKRRRPLHMVNYVSGTEVVVLIIFFQRLGVLVVMVSAWVTGYGSFLCPDWDILNFACNTQQRGSDSYSPQPVSDSYTTQSEPDIYTTQSLTVTPLSHGLTVTPRSQHLRVTPQSESDSYTTVTV